MTKGKSKEAQAERKSWEFFEDSFQLLHSFTMYQRSYSLNSLSTSFLVPDLTFLLFTILRNMVCHQEAS